MKISLSWLKDYVDLPEGTTAEEIARRLTFAGFEIESIQKQAEGLDRVFVGELLEVKQHPNADKLSLTKVNVGNALGTGAVLGVVCGARNIAVGQKIPVATLGAVIPNGLEIKAAKIRGEPSEGMLCSPAELKIESKEGTAGILILGADAKVGQPFAEYLGLDDVVFEVNVTPNRGDALSHIGIAREVAAVFGTRWKVPEVILEENPAPVRIEIASAVGPDCPAYFGRYVEGVKVGESPAWLKKRIESLGLRSVNNVVDATTYVLYEIGQPIHAFDAGKIETDRQVSVTVRSAREKENFSTISHKEIRLAAQDLVIGAGKGGEQAAALAGVMGSDATEVSESTRSVFIESADFGSLRVRRANRGHALMTDAAYRFERGVDPARIAWACDRTAELIQKVAGGSVSERFASAGSDEYAKKSNAAVAVSVGDIVRTLGVNPGADRAESILSTLGFEVKRTGEAMTAVPPSWRRDIARAEDLVEEVGRIWGYENLEVRVPHGMVAFKESIGETDRQANELRRFLTNHGFSEAMNYAFSSREAEAAALGADAKEFVEMQGIQGREFNVMKTSLVPGLLRNVSANLARGRENVRLFELRSVFAAADPNRQKGKNPKLDTLVNETPKLAVVLTGKSLSEDWEAKDAAVDFYSLKGVLETLFAYFGRSGIKFAAKDIPAWLHPGQSAGIFLGNRAFGFVGRVHPRVEKRLDLGQAVFACELDLARLVSTEARAHRFQAFARFPSVSRDFSATVRNEIEAEKIRTVALGAAKPLARELKFFDVYRGERVPAGHTSYAFSVQLASDDHTLADKELSDAQAAIMRALETELGAKFAGQ